MVEVCSDLYACFEKFFATTGIDGLKQARFQVLSLYKGVSATVICNSSYSLMRHMEQIAISFSSISSCQRCELCPIRGGALKPTTFNRFVLSICISHWPMSIFIVE